MPLDDLKLKDMGPMHQALTGLWLVWRGYEKELKALRGEVDELRRRIVILEGRIGKLDPD